jgi:hypothetical protein
LRVNMVASSAYCKNTRRITTVGLLHGLENH